jgi:AcrR family transcriptional regulator
MSDTEKIECIVRAAGELLDTAGYDSLGTTEIARQAGVSTATLYRHFEDKHQILQHLVRDLHGELSAAARATFKRLERDADWREPISALVHQTYALRIAQPGGRTARRTLHACAALREWDRSQERALARSLGQALRKRAPALATEGAQQVALTTLTAVMALLDLACQEPKQARKVLEEAVTLAQRYLAPHLDRRPAASASRAA